MAQLSREYSHDTTEISNGFVHDICAASDTISVQVFTHATAVKENGSMIGVGEGTHANHGQLPYQLTLSVGQLNHSAKLLSDAFVFLVGIELSA